MTPVVQYFDRFHYADTTVPSQKALLPIAKELDRVTEVVVKALIENLRTSPEHQARVSLLHKQPRLATNLPLMRRTLLKEASSFEQMIALGDWLAASDIRKIHTFRFSARDNDYVPVEAKPEGEADLLNVSLGSTSGSHKAPAYTTWAQSDPWQDPKQKLFIYPLEALEIARQPNYSAATILKGNPFEEELIDSDWRYGSRFACVESGGQRKETIKKQTSAGLNACTMADFFSDATDPKAEEKNIAIRIEFERYVDTGYDDDFDNCVTPGALMKAARKSIVQRDDRDLTYLMERLTIAKLGPQKDSLLRSYIAKKINPKLS